jgi:hypothetical protein
VRGVRIDEQQSKRGGSPRGHRIGVSDAACDTFREGRLSRFLGRDGRDVGGKVYHRHTIPQSPGLLDLRADQESKQLIIDDRRSVIGGGCRMHAALQSKARATCATNGRG